MKIFKDLGLLIDDNWKQFEYETNCFPDLAREALDKTNLSEVTVADICQWTLGTDEFVRQAQLDSRFGEPPLTVFANDKFHIDVLFWLSGTTAIHEHSFKGAFCVLSGSSIHTTFAYHEKCRVNEHLKFGDIQVLNIELLKRGAVRAIESGLIHALFHLDTPSVSLVVRTYNDPERRTQFTYRKPHIAFNDFYEDPRVLRQAQILRMMKLSGSSDFLEALKNYARRSTLYSFVKVVITLCHQHVLQSNEIAEVLAICKARHGDLADSISPVFTEINRINIMQKLRRSIVNPQHRFLLAVLMNASSKAHVRELIKAEFPDSEPHLLVVRWIRELSEEGKLGAELEDYQLDLIGGMLLGGGDLDEISMDLKAKYSHEQIEAHQAEIRETYSKLARFPLFQPLFSPRS